MQKWAVVQVEQDHDNVEGVECLATFSTEQEAHVEMQRRRDDSRYALVKHNAYISEFVDKIELPDTNYAGWLAFLETLGICRHWEKRCFRENYSLHLRTGGATPLAGFKPPPLPKSSRGLFVMEIKQGEN
jgi:hypothetical protein